MRRQKGEGSYDYLESKNIWRWRGYYFDSLTGERVRKEITSKERKTLRAKVLTWQNDVSNGKSKSIKVSTWAKKWLEEIVKPSTKQATYRNYSITIRNHIIPTWGKIWLDKLTASMIQSYINSLAEDHRPSTIATVRAHIRAMLESAIDYGYLSSNQARKIKLPPYSLASRKAVLTVDEVNRLLKIAKAGSYLPTTSDAASMYLHRVYYIIILLATTTGARQGEIFGITKQQIDYARNQITIDRAMSQQTRQVGTTKTGGIRVVKVPVWVMHSISKWVQYQDAFANKYNGIYENMKKLIVTNATGRPLSATNFHRRCWQPLLKKAELTDREPKITFHTLRHSHASQLLAAGVSVQAVSERLGHSSPDVTMRVYAHLLDKQNDEVTNVINQILKGGDSNGT